MVTKETRKLREENKELRKQLREAKFINTGVLRRWKENYKEKLNKKFESQRPVFIFDVPKLKKQTLKKTCGDLVESFNEALDELRIKLFAKRGKTAP